MTASPYLSRRHAFDSVASYAAALQLAQQNLMAAEFIDNTDRRRIETIRYTSQVAVILATPIVHDGSDRCPALPGTSCYIRHSLNDVILISHYPERLKWSDIISWVPIWEKTP